MHSVDQQRTGQITFLDHAKFVAQSHDLPVELGRGDQGLHRRGAEKIDEARAVADGGSVRLPREAAAAGKNADTIYLSPMTGGITPRGWRFDRCA
ncbi:hypothetical protein J2848_004375 [Azospirillum lipoferum]|uniref:hypothetical protein n=1 Tax=Azospirillum TaxID=191 RepID=UPI0014789B67|nr:MULTISPECIES: hypothetical protein [Azospirillum]MCP1612683.1 hypothetical protein [Azospirillum lipoferum]MDW5532177.1 hypothetical protein [Azospirillum sp. NL1]